MSETINRGPVIQTPYAPSVVKVGDRIIGRDVTSGILYTGDVAEVAGPIKSPDCGGYRYKLTNTGQFYGSGRPVEPTVWASVWDRPMTEAEIAAIPAGSRVQATLRGVRDDGSPITRQITVVIDRSPWFGDVGDSRGSVVILSTGRDVTAVAASSIRVLD